MITQEAAVAAATVLIENTGCRGYVFCGADFQQSQAARDDLPFLKPSAAAWIVRYSHAEQDKGTIDDGNALICVEVDAETGTATLLEGM